MKKFSLLLTLALTLAVTSCTDYDDDFKALNASISDLNSAVAELKSQVAGFSSLQTGITSLQGSVTALQTAVNSLPGEISGLKSDLADAAAEIAALQTALNSMIANYATSDDLAAAQAAINALTSQLTATQEDVATILESNNVYTGDIVINSSATLEFAVGLGEKVRVINGNLTINYSSLTAAEVAAANVVAKKVAGVIQNVSLTSTAAKGSIDVSNLKSVAGTYTVIGMDAMDDELAIITGAAIFNYDGGYNQPNLVSATSVTVTDYTTDAATGVVGTLEVNFRNLVTTNFKSGATAGTSSFASATNVVLNEGVVSVTANSATNVEIWAANNASGLTVSATTAGSVVTIAGRVDNGATTPVGQALSVTGSSTSVVNANAVGAVGAVTITAKEVNMSSVSSAGAVALTSTTSVSFPALVSAGTITASSATSFVAPKLNVSAALSIAAAKTVELASAADANYSGVATESIKFTALKDVFSAAALVALKSVDVTGKAASTNSFTATSANVALASATFGGEIDAVSVTGVGSSSDKLTSLTTTGNIDSFTLDNSDVITSISLGHGHIVGGAGTVLVITNNAKLASLKSSADFLKTLTVTGNALLTTMDFSSFQSVISTGAVAITISANKLTGGFSPAVAATATTAYVEASISQSSLLTLKPFIAAYKAAITAPASSTATIALDVQVEDVDATTAVQTLAAAMHANEAISAAIVSAVNTEGINSVAEFLLIN
jgi:hypothetical protein